MLLNTLLSLYIFSGPAKPNSMSEQVEHHHNKLLVVVGVFCLLIANFVAAYANIQLKRDAHLRAESPSVSRYTHKYLLAGVTLSVLAGFVDLAVLGIVPLGFRACSAPLNIPANVLVAKWLLSEVVGYRRRLGIMLTFIGCIEGVWSTIGGTTVSVSEILSIQTGLVPLAFLTALGATAIIADELSAFKPSSHRITSLFLASFGVAFVASCSTTCGKLISMFGMNTSFLSFKVLICAVGCVGAASLQLYLLARMLGRFDVSACIPAYRIMTMLWLSLFSYYIFGESVASPVGFVAGFAMSTVGAWMAAAGNDPSYLVMRELTPDLSPLLMGEEK